MALSRGSIGLLLVTILLSARCLAKSPSEAQILATAREIHRRALTLDTHVDIAGTQYATRKLDPGIDNPRLRCDLVKMEKGGMDGVFLAIWVRQGKRDAEAYRRAHDTAIAKFEAVLRLTKMYPHRCEPATSTEDFRRVAAAGKRAIMIGLENGYAIGAELSHIEKFYDLGARYITLCHNGHNQICDSANPSSRLGDGKAEHNGLSRFGRQVVAEMNRLGMMVDVSHLAPKSFYDVLQVSRAPVIASHCGCRALNDHPRNLDDEQLRALSKNGGVIQVVAVGSFLRAPSAERRRAIRDLAEEVGIPMGRRNPRLQEATDEQKNRFRERMREINRRHPPVGIKDYIDHVEHAVKVAGIDHVGIGSDFDGGGGVPGFNDHSEALNVTVELLRRGHAEDEIKKIWAENFLRVWRDVEHVGAQLQSGGRPGE